MKSFIRAWDKLRTIINSLGWIACVMVVAALAIQIFCRNFFGFSTTWSEEVAEVCFTGLIFCYLAQCEKDEAHLQLEIVYQIWPKTKFYLNVIGKLICMVYCGFVVYSEMILMPKITKLTTAACHIPMTWIHFLIALGCAMWLIQNIISLYGMFKERGNEIA